MRIITFADLIQFNTNFLNFFLYFLIIDCPSIKFVIGYLNNFSILKINNTTSMPNKRIYI